MFPYILICVFCLCYAIYSYLRARNDQKKWVIYGKGTIVAVEEKFRNYYGSLQKFYQYDVEIQYNNMTVRQMAGSSNVYHVGSEVNYYMEGAEFKISDGAYIYVNSAVDLVSNTQSPNTTNNSGMSKIIVLPIIIGVLLLAMTIFKSSVVTPFIGLGIIGLLFYFLFALRKNEKVKATKMQFNIDNGTMYKIDAKVIEIKRKITRRYCFYYAIILYQDADGHNRLGQIRMHRKNTYSVNSTIQVYYNSLTHAMAPIV